MPNWCENTLTITGDAKQLEKFIKKAKTKKTALSLAKIYPEPDYSKIKVKKTFGKRYAEKGEEWWDWRIQNWGTKWDIEAYINYQDEGIIEYYFDSAWSPPLEFFKEASRQYPDLQFRIKYDEPSMGFMGIAYANSGDLQEKSIDY